MTIQAVSIDMSAGYEKAVREAIPHAEICFDPFHVVKLAGEAVDRVRRAEWSAQGKSKTKGGRWVKGTRWALLKAPENRTEGQDAALAEVQQANKRLYRAFLLKEQLRELYHHVEPAVAAAYLEDWLAWASRSKLKPFVKLARTIREHREGVLAAVRLGLSNGRLEGLNSKVRLISLTLELSPHLQQLPCSRLGGGAGPIAAPPRRQDPAAAALRGARQGDPHRQAHDLAPAGRLSPPGCVHRHLPGGLGASASLNRSYPR